MTPRRMAVPLAAALVALSIAASVQAQSLQQRIRSDGSYRFSFAARPDVCGRGEHGVYSSRRSREHDEWWSACDAGPARVALTVEQGRVTSLRTYVGGQWRPASAVTDWGLVSTRAATAYLLDLTASAPDRVGRDAIFAATLADSTEIWPRLLQIARSDHLPREVRRSAVFWLGQQAATAATAGLRDLIESSEELELRKHAVFALSQRPVGESVPALITIVRRERMDPRLKKTALFWLSQKDDPRVLTLFQELLTR